MLKTWLRTNVHRQAQHILSVPSTQATCCGNTDHPQALITLHLKCQIKCI